MKGGEWGDAGRALCKLFAASTAEIGLCTKAPTVGLRRLLSKLQYVDQETAAVSRSQRQGNLRVIALNTVVKVPKSKPEEKPRNFHRTSRQSVNIPRPAAFPPEKTGRKRIRCVLAAQSSPLRAMFEGSFKEGNENVIALRDVEPASFSLLLDFLYGSGVEVVVENVEALLDLSARYGVSPLRRHCCAFLAASATPGRACSLLALADRYDCHRLRRQLLAYTLEVRARLFLLFSLCCLPVLGAHARARFGHHACSPRAFYFWRARESFSAFL